MFRFCRWGWQKGQHGKVSLSNLSGERIFMKVFFSSLVKGKLKGTLNFENFAKSFWYWIFVGLNGVVTLKACL